MEKGRYKYCIDAQWEPEYKDEFGFLGPDYHDPRFNRKEYKQVADTLKFIATCIMQRFDETLSADNYKGKFNMDGGIFGSDPNCYVYTPESLDLRKNSEQEVYKKAFKAKFPDWKIMIHYCNEYDDYSDTVEQIREYEKVPRTEAEKLCVRAINLKRNREIQKEYEETLKFAVNDRTDISEEEMEDLKDWAWARTLLV